MAKTTVKYVSNRPAISLGELQKMFPYMSRKELQYDKENNRWVKLEKFLEQEQKTNDDYRVRAELPDVVSLDIRIEWKRNRTWGYNPHAYYRASFADGTSDRGHFTCSGCGYDKASTVIAKVYNAVCSGMLWRMRKTKKEVPYGVRLGSYFPVFDGGVGVSCYRRITEFMGGTWDEYTWEDESTDYTITFPAKKSRKTA